MISGITYIILLANSPNRACSMRFSRNKGLVKAGRRPPADALFSKLHVVAAGGIDTGEDKVAVAAKQRSVILLEVINKTKSEATLCFDCLGWLGWLGWLAWLYWLPRQATLEASEGPDSEPQSRNRLLPQTSVGFGSCAGIICSPHKL